MRYFTAFVFCALLFTACTEANPPFSVNEDGGLHTAILGDSSGQLLYGKLYLDYPADSFLTEFEVGDIVTVAIVGYDTFDIPVAVSVSDVPIAGFVLTAITGSGRLPLAAHYGNLAEILKINDVKTPIEVIVTLKEKGGYQTGLEIIRNSQNLSFNIKSYPELSIEEFANFREVRTTGIGKGKLYRSSSPIDLSLGRNLYADSLAKEAGINTFINLADTKNDTEFYKGFENSYYSSQNTIFLSLPVEFFSTPFKEGLVNGFRYMSEHDSPYLVHCTYGMDRTGFTIAVLEALMGATAEEIQADYAKTFSNYYNVVDGKQVPLSEQQVEFFKSVVLRNLRTVYHAEGINIPDTGDADNGNADWASATEQYLQKLGMTLEEISSLKNKLR